MSLDLDVRLFYIRTKSLLQKWESNNNEDKFFRSSTSLVLAAGSRDEDRPYSKLTAMQTWLLGYECPDTILMFTKNENKTYKLIIFASKKKLELLSALKEKPEDIELNLTVDTLLRNKKTDNKEQMQSLLDQAGNCIGTLVAEMHIERECGPFLTGWRNFVEDSDRKVVEISDGIALTLAVKDAQELGHIEGASTLSSKVLKRQLLRKIEDALEEGKNPPHSRITDQVEEFMSDHKKLQSLKLPSNANNVELIDSCFAPIIQSGSNFDLKPSAASDDNKLDPGVIVISLGVRYSSYCSNLARTYFIDPSKEQGEKYEALLQTYERALAWMKPGELLSNIYNKVKEDLTPSGLNAGLMRNIGFGMGLEFKESYLALKATNNVVIEKGMIFTLRVGVKVPGTKYAMLLADTVVIEDNGARCLTNVARKFADVSYDLAGSEDEVETAPVKNKEKSERMKAAAMALDSGRTRRSARAAAAQQITEKDREALAEREAHQRELGMKVNQNALERLTTGGEKKSKIKYKSPADFTAYRRNIDMPRDASKSQVIIDRRAMSVLLPICGFIVPLHVSIIKAVVKQENYLRFQLITPISMIPKDPATQVFKDKRAVFIKELSFRIDDESRLQGTFRACKELRKQFTDEQTQQRQKQTLIKQPDLILAKSRGARLTDVHLRPSLTRGKTSGTLEAHSNGFRFRSDKGGRVDIIYANIKHAFFQPSEKELITVVHFHLRTEIMIGKKKVKDIQFYTEVMEASQALDARLQSDGIDEEKRERAMRNKINKTFEIFVKKVDDQIPDIEFDIPYRELGFFGAPNKSNVMLQPTVNCLINITESPFFVLTLNEVEFVHFERVHFNNRSFDMVVIKKDYTKPVTVVRSIERDSIDQLRDWLDSVNIHFTEGPTTFKWPALLKRAADDPHMFFEVEGGWQFLSGGVDDAEGDDEESSEEAADEFAPDDEELELDDESFESEEEEEEFSESEEEGDDSGEEGMDWDELEKRAARDDRKRVHREEMGGARKRHRH